MATRYAISIVEHSIEGDYDLVRSASYYEGMTKAKVTAEFNAIAMDNIARWSALGRRFSVTSRDQYFSISNTEGNFSPYGEEHFSMKWGVEGNI